jgi:DNA recombination protein RmuC
MIEIALTITLVLLAVSIIACSILFRQRNQLRDALEYDRQRTAELDKDLAVSRQMHEADERRLKEFKEQIETHLKALTGDALKQSNTQFLELAEQKLRPITELLRQYDVHYKQIEQSRKMEYGGLKEATSSLLGQTQSLATALRRPEVRGRWGEIALRRIAELAGMKDRCDFTEQYQLETDEGRLRPDLVVHLPNGRNVVVDSKMVFDAFTDAVRLPEGDERSAKMMQHVGQIQEQIKKLSSKAYTDQFDRAPDFVILFIPIESALYAALEADGELLERAFRQKVVIATPTLLIALLKTIELGWHEQKLTENAETLRELGEELHVRISKALEHVINVGASLGRTVKDYNELAGSLDARVMPTLRKFEQAGGRSSKELPGAIESVDLNPRTLQSTTTQTSSGEIE